MHGTGVAGIIAAPGGNGIGVAGVAWGSTPIAIKAFDVTGYSSTCLSARAINWARTRAIPIVNMSYKYDTPDPAERAAARNAFYSGMLLVSAMGNENSAAHAYPARYINTVCAVGAFFGDGHRWDETASGDPDRGSNMGSWIDLSAPGGMLITTTDQHCRQSTNSYYDLADCEVDFGGTSAATPVVSGVAALLLSEYASLLGEDLYHAMIKTARHPNGLPFDSLYGYGHVRADTALKFLASPKVILHRRETGFSVVSVDTSQRYLQNYPGLANGFYSVGRHRMRKWVSFSPSFESTPVVWVRSSGSFGAKDTMNFNYEEEVYWGRVVSVSASGCSLETVVYNIPSAPLIYQWYPILPSPHVAVALTIVGVPAAGKGPSSGEPAPRDPPQGEGGPVPGAFALRQNHPNPFSALTTIRFELPVEARVRLEIFDAQGRLVRALADARYPAGYHGVNWDQLDASGHRLGAGVYVCRMRAGTFTDRRKIALLPR